MTEVPRPREWWQDGVLYHIYCRSFADANGDGVGDLRGITGRLDHLRWLGVDGIWLSPVHPSPNRDWGYDVADYLDVHPELGTLEDLDELVREAGTRGIRVLLDLVPNHTSDAHPWFVEARASRSGPRREWYVWADPGPDGGPPSNWRSLFGGGPAWTLDAATGQYFLHNFLPSMPDLNWWNDEVRSALEGVQRFWYARGVAGFRIDVCYGLVHDRELRDNPPFTAEDDPHMGGSGQRWVYNLNRPEAHDVLRAWRALANEQRTRGLLVGETYMFDLSRLARFYGEGDELDLGFNFPFLFAPFHADDLAGVVERTLRALPEQAWPAWTASSHDAGRFPTRWADGDEALTRCALLVLLGLPGTPVLYYGDEIGMPEVALPAEALRDPLGLLLGPERGRDRGRTPMQWSARPGAGFTDPGVDPWLPIGDHRGRNVADQREAADSTLRFCRDLLRLRRALPDLRSPTYEPIEIRDGLWAWRRGAATAVAVNLSGEAAPLEGVRGRVLLRTSSGSAEEGSITIGAGEGAVLELSATI